MNTTFLLSDRQIPVTKEWLVNSFHVCDGSPDDSFTEFLLCNPVENFERPLTYRWVAASDHLNVSESLCCYFCGKHLPHIKTRGQVRDLIAALS